MRKSIAGLAGIVLLSAIGCQSEREKPIIPLTVYQEKKEDGSVHYFNKDEQRINLVDVECAGPKEDFVEYNGNLYQKTESPEPPEPQKPEYLKREQSREEVLQEIYKSIRHIVKEENEKALNSYLKHSEARRHIMPQNQPTAPPQNNSQNDLPLTPVEPRK